MLVGPRGSGKTTLLKMLQLSALQKWTSPLRDSVVKELDFTAVYLAADYSWTSLFSLDDRPMSTEVQRIIASSLFNTYLQYSFLDALEEISNEALLADPDLKKFYVDVSKVESTICSALASQWLLDGNTPTFFILRSKLGLRLHQISQLTEDVRAGEKSGVSEVRGNHPFVDLHFSLLLKTTVDTINACIGQRERHWCICVDELEIIPESLRRIVFRALRSVDPRILLKLSLSPFSVDLFENKDGTIPMPGQDYSPIYLSYPRSADAVRFGRQLANSLLSEMKLESSSLEHIFGHSDEAAAEPTDRAPLSVYAAPNGERYKLFARLDELDPSFHQFLQKRRYDIRRMPNMSESERAQLRKLLQIVRARLEFRDFSVRGGDSSDRGFRRSRKRIHSMYTGIEALLTICEGNPRWILGILHPLIGSYKVHVERHSNSTRVDRARQARQISRVVIRYRALLSTIPFAKQKSGQKATVLELIDKIGEYMFRDVVLRTFKPEPVLSFVVDQKVSEAQIMALGSAINQGAFVLVPNRKGESTEGLIRSSRFRMSYLLAPEFQLPLTYGAQINLSSILSSEFTQFFMDDL